MIQSAAVYSLCCNETQTLFPRLHHITLSLPSFLLWLNHIFVHKALILYAWIELFLYFHIRCPMVSGM